MDVGGLLGYISRRGEVAVRIGLTSLNLDELDRLENGHVDIGTARYVWIAQFYQVVCFVASPRGGRLLCRYNLP